MFIGISNAVTRLQVDTGLRFLFANGEAGAWYDPSDLSTLFQDAAGTTPVTADGDPVGLMLDKSGNDHHASQAVSASRPTYRTAGGLHWLEFDGVDDHLNIATLGFAADAGFFFAYGGALTTAGRVINRAATVDALYYASGRWLGAFTTDTLDSGPSGFDLTADHVGEYNIISGAADLTYNGTEGPTATTTGKVVDLDSMVIGARLGGSVPCQMTLFGFVAVEGGADSAARSRVRSYLARKTGVTL